MPCSQTLAGIARDCSTSMGGIERVLLANRDDVSSENVQDGKITEIQMTGSAKFKEYRFRPGTSSMTSTWQFSAENGTRFVQTDLVMIFSRMETLKRIEVEALAQSDLVAIVQDSNGAYWYLGRDNAVTMTDGDGQTGTARTDRNGYSVTLQDNSLGLPYEVDPSIIAGLVG